MATHSSVLAWRIPGKAEPSGLPSVGSHRVGHDWSDAAAAAAAAAWNSLRGQWMRMPSFHLSLSFSLSLCYQQMYISIAPYWEGSKFGRKLCHSDFTCPLDCLWSQEEKVNTWSRPSLLWANNRVIFAYISLRKLIRRIGGPRQDLCTPGSSGHI